MFQLHVAAAGRLREPYWTAACEEYRKRLGRYCRYTEREYGDTESPEAPKGFYKVALCIEGESCSSESFADRLQGWQTGGISRVAFLIGGSEGLSEAVKKSADWRFSLSPMTFPHHMARAILLEQIYRAFTILQDSPYHK